MMTNWQQGKMTPKSIPGQKGFAVLKEAVYQNTCTFRKSTQQQLPPLGSTYEELLLNNHINSKIARSPSGNYCTSYNTVSPGTRYHFVRPQASSGTGTEVRRRLDQQNIPPVPEEPPPPLPPKRSTSLMGTTNPRHTTSSVRESQTMNPKRVSIATSEFWKGHPDLGHFVSGWELGPREKVETSSVWGANEQGGTESLNLWGDPPAVKKGILLLQRDKLWARWKERYCILTRDYLHCFRRTTSTRSGVRMSEMGTFIFKLRLADIDTTEWESRKSGPMIAIHLPQESRLLIRAQCDTYEALQEWHTLLQECVYLSKERRNALRSNHNMNTSSTHSKSTSTMSTTNSSASSSGLSVRTKDSSGKSSPDTTGSSEGSPNSTTKSAGSTGEYEEVEDRLPVAPNPAVLRVKDRPNAPAIWRSSHHEAIESNANNNNKTSRLSLNLSNVRLDSVHKHPSAPGGSAAAGRYNYIDFGDDDSDYDDAELADNFPVHTRQRCSRASIAVDGASYAPSSRTDQRFLEGGPSMTLHDFVKNPWKNRNSIAVPNHSSSHNFPSFIPSSQPRDRSSLALPRETPQRQRPESWNPTTTKIDLSNYFSPWDKSRGGGGGGGVHQPNDFSRNRDSIYSTSRHTSEITFRKLS